MKRLKYILAAAALLLGACNNGGVDVRFHRFERLLFDTPTESLQQVLDDSLQVYSTPLLNVAPHNQQYMQALGAFVNDPAVRRIYSVSDSLYRDLGWLEEALGKALQRSHKLCPEMTYDGFYTLITADFEDYRNRVFCTDHELALSIDRYAVGKLPGTVPAYIERISRPEYIAADCMEAIARANTVLPEGDLTLLDYAIAEGKAIYYAQQTLPKAHDTILLRYSADQLAWMKANTEQVWGWLIQNKMLYTTDLSQIRNIIDEAPHTNAFGQNSAPRTTSYIGWQIVSRYMKKSGASMQQLLYNSDSREILSTSGWRP